MLQFEDGFFEGEERESFYVEPMMKRAWAVQLEVLRVIDEICTRHNIAYYADWGTLLGAIRHKGFIPWDDDLDICMMRKDYERFLKIAENELPKEWAILTIDKYDDWNRYLARVVNTRKIPLDASEMQAFYGFPFMAGVDIFQLDNIPNDKEEQETHLELFRAVHDLARAWDKGDREDNMANLRMVEECCNVKFTEDKTYQQQLMMLVDKIAGLYMNDEAEDVTQMYMLEKKSDFRIPISCYEASVRVPFENITIPVPLGYHEILTTYYGDYMTPVCGTAEHDYPFYKEQRKEIFDAYEAQGIEVPESLIELLGG